MNFLKRMKEFFDENKKRIREKDISICIGNEACDVDSFISSLVTAFHDSLIHVICMSREVFMAKGDVGYVLKHFNIDPDDLIYLEKPIGDFSTEARKLGTKFSMYKKDKLVESYPLKEKNVDLCIVDHNEPIIELQDAKLDLIIDHHALSKGSVKARRIYIDLDVGSCSTLISKYIGHSLIMNTANKTDDFEDSEITQNIAKLLLVPIILDTSNFKRRASHFDVGEFEKLLRQSNVTRKEMKQIRKGIRKHRLNDADQPNDIIMQKDFKIYHHRGLTFGCATVKYPAEEWVDREGRGKDAGVYLEAYFNTFRRNFGLDFLFINRKKGDKRYLIINNCSFESVLAKENNFKPIEYKGLHYYEIDVKKSRKVMMPIVIETINRFYKNMKKREEEKEKRLKEGISVHELQKELKREKKTVIQQENTSSDDSSDYIK